MTAVAVAVACGQHEDKGTGVLDTVRNVLVGNCMQGVVDEALAAAVTALMVHDVVLRAVRLPDSVVLSREAARHVALNHISPACKKACETQNVQLSSVLGVVSVLRCHGDVGLVNVDET